MAGLPPEQELKVKMSSLKICFRHYGEDDFFHTAGNQLRVKRGKFRKDKLHSFRQNIESLFQKMTVFLKSRENFDEKS